MELNLIKQIKKSFEVQGVKFECKIATPILQAEVLQVVDGLSGAEMIKQIEIITFLFETVVEKITMKGVEYQPIEFFNMINFIDEGSQVFLGDSISEIIGAVFMTEQEIKK